MKTFCSNCGTPIEYASKKPNFCPSCGNSLGGIPPKIVATTNPKVNSYEEADDDISYQSNSNYESVDSNQILVDFSFIKKGVPIEAIIGSAPIGDVNRPKKTKKEIKEFFESMKTLKRHDLNSDE